MFDINKIKGSFATIITPFTEGNNGIDEAELKKEIEFLCSTDISGLFPLASTSEYPFMSYETKKQYLKAVSEANNGRKAMLAGCCGVNYTESLQLLALAKEYGYDAAVICPPYYFQQSPDEEYRYYTKLADNPYGVKIIMYNIPCFTSEIPVETVAELMKNPNIVGIKDSSGNMRRIRNMADLKGDRKDFVIYCGNDDIILPALVAGAEGSLTGMGCLLPEVISTIFKGYWSGDMETAQKAQACFLSLCRVADGIPFPAGYKIMAELRGMNAGYIHQFCDPEKAAKVRTDEKPLLDKILADYNCADAVM